MSQAKVVPYLQLVKDKGWIVVLSLVTTEPLPRTTTRRAPFTKLASFRFFQARATPRIISVGFSTERYVTLHGTVETTNWGSNFTQK